MIVLDTHALIWWTILPKRLGRGATNAIERAERLGVPTIVFWETALLVRKRRVELGMRPDAWAREIMKSPRVEPLELTVDIALAADALEMHADPVDRFIVATAIHHDAQLVSKDALISAVKGLRTIW